MLKEAGSLPSDGEIADARDLVSMVGECRRRFGRVPQFRGSPDAAQPLVPALFRDRADGWKPADIEVYERTLTRDFMRYARSRHAECPGGTDYTGWASMMRHYGLPTRLLDWTASIFVAAFFAASEEPGKAGAIWALDGPGLNRIATGHEEELSIDGANPVVRGLIDRAFTGGASIEETVHVLAPEIDPRLQMQQASFTAHGSATPLERHPMAAEFLARCIIPAERKRPLVEELDSLGFNRMTIFPDLENVARTLAERRYR